MSKNPSALQPLFRANWERLFLFNYTIRKEVVQKHVPFEVETFAGHAYVSLVAFSVTKMRLVDLPNWQRILVAPLGEHEFLNVRTYVNREGEEGIYFLAEFVNRLCSVPLGRISYGLPYQYAEIRYRETGAPKLASGAIRQRGTGEEFKYETKPFDCNDCRHCEPGSEAEFLMERYVAFTRWGGLKRMFKIHHAPWQYCPIEIENWDDRLIKKRIPWLEDARLVSAYYSPGAFDVGIGWPHWVN